MKLSKTPPINQACQGIDFLSSFSSSLSLPAPLDSEAPDVSQCKTNVAQRVKEWLAPTHTYKTALFFFFFFFTNFLSPASNPPFFSLKVLVNEALLLFFLYLH